MIRVMPEAMKSLDLSTSLRFMVIGWEVIGLVIWIILAILSLFCQS